jgi:hypothetical protein
MRRRAFAVGALGLAAAGIGAWLDLRGFLESWLLGFVFWLSLPLGSLALVMLHHLTGGSWGFATRRLLEAGMRTLPLAALFFVPLAFGAHSLYEWAHPEAVAADPLLAEKHRYYLNVPFTLARAAFYFGLWILLAFWLDGLSRRMDRTGDPRVLRRMRAISGPGLALYGVSLTFASVDWVMSLEPHWYSTIYGMRFIVAQALVTLAFAIVLSAWLSRREPFSRWIGDEHFHDLGKLLFTCVILWAYVAFSQWLILWSGNLLEEIPYYLRRTRDGWGVLALSLILLHFALPFALLLSRRLKRNARALAMVAAWLIALHWFDLAWVIVPAFPREGAALTWLDLAASVAMGGIGFGVFVWQLQGRPLVSLQDAGLEGALERPAVSAP